MYRRARDVLYLVRGHPRPNLALKPIILEKLFAGLSSREHGVLVPTLLIVKADIYMLFLLGFAYTKSA
jgi:hypothetical protein